MSATETILIKGHNAFGSSKFVKSVWCVCVCVFNGFDKLPKSANLIQM